MAIRTSPAIEYAFPATTGTLATGLTLAASTRYNFDAITVQVPPTASRVFKSAYLDYTFRDYFTAGADIDGLRFGFLVGTASFVDQDFTVTSVNTGDHGTFRWLVDVTDQMQGSFGTGTSNTCQAAIAVATSASSNINNLSCKLVFVYQYEDANVAQIQNTVRIPIQSHIGTLSGSHIEIGCMSGTAGTDAPPNQYPALHTFCPETGKVFDQVFLELWANDYNGSVSSSPYMPYIQLDNAAEIPRAQVQQALITNVPWHDILIVDTTASFLTGSAHAIKMRSDLTDRVYTPGGLLTVTYRFDSSSTQRLMSQVVPMSAIYGDQYQNEDGVNGTASLPDVHVGRFRVMESGSIGLVQSGIWWWNDMTSNGVIPSFTSGGNTVYRKLVAGAGNASSGQQPCMYRCDLSGGLSIARGDNMIVGKVFVGDSLVGRITARPWAIVNYTASVPAATNYVTSAPRAFVLWDTDTLATTRRATGSLATVPVLGSDYSVSSVMLDAVVNSSTWGGNLGMSTTGSEWSLSDSSRGLMSTGFFQNQTPSGERMLRQMYPNASKWFNMSSRATGRANIENQRPFMNIVDSGNHEVGGVVLWVTHDNLTFDVAGRVLSGSTPVTSSVVEVYAVSASAVHSVAELVMTASTDAAGQFTASVLDNTRQYFASWTRYRSDYGTPGSSVFNISVLTGSGGGDVVAPTIRNFVPATGTALGLNQAVQFDVFDNLGSGSLRRVVVHASFATSVATVTGSEVVHDGERFNVRHYSGSQNVRTAITGASPPESGYRYVVLRDGGWPNTPPILYPFIEDTSGNENT